MRVILVPVAARPESESALQAAFRLAGRLGSDVFGCHFQAVPIEPGNWDLVDLWTLNEPRVWPVLSEEERQRLADEARQLFDRVAADSGFPVSDTPGSPGSPVARWETRSGGPGELMPALGAISDLIVVSRAPERGGEKAWAVLTSALLESLRPVLVLPQTPVETAARRIAVAWNRGRTENLALHAALPLVKAADDVVLVTVGDERRRSGASAEEMIGYLAAHGVSARARRVERADAGAALIETAAAEGADLLLAGAYTKGRFREMIFGGVTEHLLTRSELPVLMMHA